MFSLIYGFWKWFTTQDEYRFLIIGIDNAGKTTTLEQIKRTYGSRENQIPLERVTPTIGLNLCHVNVDRKTAAVFWDLGGQLMLRHIWANHFAECDGIIFIVDSTDVNRLEEVRQTFESVINHPSIKLKDLPILFLMNKKDCNNSINVSAIVDSLQLRKIISSTLESGNTTKSKIHIPYSFASGKFAQICNTLEKEPRQPNESGVARPYLVSIAECSAIQNVNIKEGVDQLLLAARKHHKTEAVSVMSN